jgi:membrane protease YdiL (CAAX protease family)
LNAALSLRIDDDRRPGRQIVALAVAAGFGLLLARRWIQPLQPRDAALAGLALVYVALAWLALRAPVEPGHDRALGVPLVVAFGVGAVAAVWRLSLPAPPLPAGPAVLALNTLAAVSEEAFFRRFLYGRLVRLGAPVAIGVSAAAFALIHLPGYGVAVLPVDLGAGLLLSWQRWASGTWLAPAATHAAANFLAVMT